ncbi:tetratricopeptide repeat protein 17-like [Ptychodera flava]|uniref:tetratricopeptide repeat protein 17-like n=1 Tax=Ptychodera flava TaxID=63121 RepID=UPI003969DEF3
MFCDVPCMTYVAFYFVSVNIVQSNSPSSSATHWKLSEQDGVVLVTPAHDDPLQVASEDPVLSILARKYRFGKVEDDEDIESCETSTRTCDSIDSLQCGEPAVKTDYDHLEGIRRRHSHPNFPEPEVAMIFKKTEGDQIDMNSLETTLKQNIQHHPSSLSVLNEVGNFWRVKGNTLLAIECFRKALSLQPNNPDILINLARILFNLQYLEDAVYLTRKSLEMKSPEQNTWLQHFTLGEILKSLGHYREAADHLRHAEELNPTFHPIRLHLEEMQSPPNSSATVYTLIIIGCLIICVFVCLHLATEGHKESSHNPRRPKCAVPWDRARFPVPPRLLKLKKYNI